MQKPEARGDLVECGAWRVERNAVENPETRNLEPGTSGEAWRHCKLHLGRSNLGLLTFKNSVNHSWSVGASEDGRNTELAEGDAAKPVPHAEALI